MKRTSRRMIIGGLIACVLLGAGAMYVRSRLNTLPHLVSGAMSSTDHAAFPDIDTAQLSPVQRKIIETLKQEYAAQPPGTKYSQGADEPWCADFVSWIFKESSAPLANPNTGAWRIPGTYTLRDYYESTRRFKPAGSGYAPRVGDIMLYDNPSPFGQHTNIVIKNHNGIITTVGGNEPGGIRVYIHKTPDKAGLVGYGLLVE